MSPASGTERRVRVALVQDAPAVFDLERTLDRVEAHTTDAAKQGAQLVLFPEAFVSAYPFGVTFGAVVGSRTAEGHELFRRYWASSVDVPGPATDRLSAIAAENGVVLAVPIVEREGGTLYCTVLFVGSDGALLGKHRKLVPTGAERLVWGQGDGSTMPVLDTPAGRIGAVICWENYMPLVRAAMYAKGVEIYLAPTADDPEIWIATVRHIAKEGRCFVLSACQYLRRSDCPPDYPAEADADEVLLSGGSCVVSPAGDLLVEPDYDGPRLIVTDLDLDDIPRGKYDLDVVGHYARPDVFSLHVDDSPRTSVVSRTDLDELSHGPPQTGQT